MPLELIGAFLSGVGSIVGAGWAIRRTVKHMERQCDLRMDAYREGLDRGKEQ